MLGAIAGDITDSAYEARPVQKTDFDLFPLGPASPTILR